MASPGDGTAISGGGMPDTGCGTPFRPVPAEFNHWSHHIGNFCLKFILVVKIILIKSSQFLKAYSRVNL